MREDFEQFADEIRRSLTADAQQAPPPAEAPPILSTVSALDLQQKISRLFAGSCKT